MTGKWTNRVQPPGVPSELQQARAAAEDLARQGSRAQGRTGLVFQTVSQVLLIGSAAVSATLGAVHLWRALAKANPPHGPHHHQPGEGGSGGRQPPRRHAAHGAAGHGRE
jgi:hypothetical protein